MLVLQCNTKSFNLFYFFSSDVDQIQKGMGEKLGSVVQYVTTCLGGVILAFVKSWQLTLVILSVTVVILVPSVVISAKVSVALVILSVTLVVLVPSGLFSSG